MIQIKVNPANITLIQICHGRVIVLPMNTAAVDVYLVEPVRLPDAIPLAAVIRPQVPLLGALEDSPEAVVGAKCNGSGPKMSDEPVSSGRVILSESSYRRGSSQERESPDTCTARPSRRLYRGSNWARAEALGKDGSARKTTCYRPRELPRQCARKSTSSSARVPLLLNGSDIKIENS